MKMTDKKALARLVRDVMDTGVRELTEDEALLLMAQAAESGLTEEQSRRQFPDLWRYFRFHPDAREQYDILLDSFELSPAPRRRPIPARPDSISLWERVKDAITSVFPTFDAPAYAPSLARGETLRTAVVPLDDTYRLAVTIAVSDDDPQQRQLTLLVETDDAAARAMLEGSPVWLQVGDDGPTILELALDPYGGLDVAESMAPGRYTLRLQLGGRHYAVKEMDVA